MADEVIDTHCVRLCLVLSELYLILINGLQRFGPVAQLVRAHP